MSPESFSADQIPQKRLYRVPEAMALLSASRSVLYEQIRSGRLRAVKQGRSRLIPESAIRDYIELLEDEAQGGMMAKRRSRDDGGVHWDENRQRWVATATLGYDGRGKRIVKRASRKTKTAAKNKLTDMMRDHADGLPAGDERYTVENAIRSWLSYGLNGREQSTIETYKYQIEQHILPHLGARRLRDLSADEGDKWLADRAKVLSTRTLRMLHSILNRAVRQAHARDKVKRNVVPLCEVPAGTEGRPSKALTLEQAEAVLNASENSRLHAYIVLSILIGARTEELRALTWDLVDLDGDPHADPPVPRSIAVWRSVRAKGETKTKKSRRTLALPMRCVIALRAHRIQQRKLKHEAGPRWNQENLVFPSAAGTELDSHNVRRDSGKSSSRQV